MRRHAQLQQAIFSAVIPVVLVACELAPTTVLEVDASPDANVADAMPFVCPFEQLPFTGDGQAPLTITGLRLECLEDFITPHATATHPVAGALADVQQAVGIFLDTECLSIPRMATTALVSGQESAFVALVDRRTDSALFAEICASTEWPMSVFMGTTTEFPTTLGNIMVEVREAPSK